jgi:putative DNA primase/helicase
LRDEFVEFVGTVDSAAPAPIDDWYVEPWPEAVETAALLQEVVDKIGKHLVARPHEKLTKALWAAMAWVHEVAATHSPILVATSAEGDSGKTTAIGILSFLVPKPHKSTELTGPNVYRFVDREKPTLFVDDADDLFRRKTDLGHIFNAGWTRGTKIPRQVQGVTVWFDPFCPKAIGLVGLNMPRTLVTRGIIIKLWPKKAEEKVEDFLHIDDAEFGVLRRKLARWSADHAMALKDARPLLPAGFNNRAAANWRLLLAIAELAGGAWPEQARDAAARLSRTVHKPSQGMRLLEAFRGIFATGRKEITSAALADQLNADPAAMWCEFNHGGNVTQRQVAHLLDAFDIHPIPLHPTRRKDFARRGYKFEQFTDAFARCLPGDAIIRSPAAKTRRKARKAKR